MYRESLISAIKEKYQEEVKFAEQLDYFTTWINDYFDEFKDLEIVSQKSGLVFKRSEYGIGINDYYLEFRTYNKTIKVNINPILGDPEATIDEYRYNNGMFINRDNHPLSYELMDNYLKRAFEGKWDK